MNLVEVAVETAGVGQAGAKDAVEPVLLSHTCALQHSSAQHATGNASNSSCIDSRLLKKPRQQAIILSAVHTSTLSYCSSANQQHIPVQTATAPDASVSYVLAGYTYIG